jgi:hypothetical protein
MNLHNGRNVKWNVSRDEYFFEGLEHKINTFCMSADGLEIVLAFLQRTLNIKFLLASIETLTSSKNVF